MPDTKTGRERKGLDKRAQLERRLARRDAQARAEDDVEPFTEPEPEPVPGTHEGTDPADRRLLLQDLLVED